MQLDIVDNFVAPSAVTLVDISYVLWFLKLTNAFLSNTTINTENKSFIVTYFTVLFIEK